MLNMCKKTPYTHRGFNRTAYEEWLPVLVLFIFVNHYDKLVLKRRKYRVCMKKRNEKADVIRLGRKNKILGRGKMYHGFRRAKRDVLLLVGTEQVQRDECDH